MSRKNKVKKEISATQGFHMLFWSVMCLFLVAIPLVINNFMVNGHIPTANDLGNAEWLSFWGGYLGSAFGVIASLFAFMFTYIQNEKQHKQTREEMKNSERLSVRPYIIIPKVEVGVSSQETAMSITKDGSIEGDKYRFLFGGIEHLVHLRNIGANHALDLKIESNDGENAKVLGYILTNRTIKVELDMPSQNLLNKKLCPPIIMRIAYTDIMGFAYYQKLQITNPIEDQYCFHLSTPPEPIISLDKTPEHGTNSHDASAECIGLTPKS